MYHKKKDKKGSLNSSFFEKHKKNPLKGVFKGFVGRN